MSAPGSVLLIDDDASLRRVVEFTLLEDGLSVRAAASGSDALKALDLSSFDVVITDVRMPGMSGVDLLAELRRRDPGLPVVLITAFATVELAVEAMRKGAFDYLSKPFSREALKASVHRALRVRKLEADNVRLRAERSDVRRIVGESPPMRMVTETLRRAAASSATVLITGESGTGKELAARAIHDWSARADRPWVVVNCGAIPRDLVESELFGHVRGSFTGAVRDHEGKFQAADGGTLFLDEVAELDPSIQVKLLRVLQELSFERVGETRTRQVDVRVVAATNVDLESAVAAGTLRTDLFYRLSVLTVKLPPLRERREDIPALVKHLLGHIAPGERLSVDPPAIEALGRREWKGNVRELSNVLERAVAMRGSDTLTVDDLGQVTEPRRTHLVDLPSDGVSLDEVVRDAVLQALSRTGWNRSQAARLLRVPRHILLYRMQKLGIGAPDAGPHDPAAPPEEGEG
ncbi:MAG: sigma-54-dependent transcriptional regulator [Myxococcaceae bacterium]